MKREMRGGRLLFFFSLAFICGNLIARYVSATFSYFLLSLVTALCFIVIATLLSLILKRKKHSLCIFFLIFFFIGWTSLSVKLFFNGEFDKYAPSTSSHLFEDSRKQFENRLERVISSKNRENYSILLALSTGNKKMISKETKEHYRKSGTSHLLALSGLHVGIIYTLLAFILSVFGSSFIGKCIRSTLIIGALWFYALFTGLSPSIWRAVLMTTFYQIGELLTREKDGFNALGISAIVIGIIDPFAPSTVSFQLSFAAMFGIFILLPKMIKLLPLKRVPKYIAKPLSYIWGIISMSISCQLFTLPLSLYYFGSFSYFFLPANILSMPLMGIIMPLELISIVTVDIPKLGTFFATLLEFGINLLNEIMKIISQLQ